MKRRAFLRNIGALSASSWIGSKDGFAAPKADAGQQFQLGAISDELSQDLEQALKIMKAHGLHWIELRTVGGKYNTEASPGEVKRIRDLVRAYGFKVSVVDTALFKCDLPGTKNVVGEKDAYPYSGQMDLLKRAMDRADAFGTDKIRVFAFWRTARPRDSFPQIAQELAKAAETAARSKMRLLLEDEGSCNVGCGRELAAMLKLVPATNLGANWDVGNGYWHEEVSYPTGYSLLPKSRVWHVHLKDVHCGGEPTVKQKSEAWRLKAGQQLERSSCRTAIVGTGQVNLRGQLLALWRDHHDCTMSLEPEYEAPGISHQQATVESLENLQKIMREIER
jgi:L-ribulose-5-phosphate 3-epimerase